MQLFEAIQVGCVHDLKQFGVCEGLGRGTPRFDPNRIIVELSVLDPKTRAPRNLYAMASVSFIGRR